MLEPTYPTSSHEVFASQIGLIFKLGALLRLGNGQRGSVVAGNQLVREGLIIPSRPATSVLPMPHYEANMECDTRNLLSGV